MTPNLTELIQRVESARKETERKYMGPPPGVLRERQHTDALLARLLSVIRCEECRGTGFALDPETNCGYFCPTCSPDRAAIERMK